MGAPRFFVGTSGYSYKEWKGSFYPDDLPAKKFLHFYGEQFDTVEMNGTFYRMPTASALAEWTTQVPNEFRFVVKAPQSITHFKRLRECKEPLAQLLEATAALKKQLGPLLFQLPSNFKKDVPRLGDFLKLLPKKLPVAFEFRNQTWFDDEVMVLLKKHKVALCIAEAEDDLKTPFEATADWGYLRLRMADYTDAELKAWIKKARDRAWNEMYVFFKHEDEGTGPKFAKRFLKLAGK